MIDRCGITASTLCAVHCVVTGLLCGVLTSVGASFLSHPLVEVAFALMALGFGVWAARAGMSHHGQWWPLLLLVGGLVTLWTRFFMHFGGSWNALFQPHAHHHPSTPELILSVSAGLCLVGFHVANSLLIRRSPHLRASA